MIQNGHDLLAGDAREPGKEVVDGRALAEILEGRGDGHAGAAKDSGAAHDVRRAFNRHHILPIIHRICLPFWLSALP